jgi:hypothetical protein
MCQHGGYNYHCMDIVPSLRSLGAPTLYWFLLNKPICWLPRYRDITVGSAPTCRLPPNANREPELVVPIWSFPREFLFFSATLLIDYSFRCKYGGRRCLWIGCPLYLFASGLAACLCPTPPSSCPALWSLPGFDWLPPVVHTEVACGYVPVIDYSCT